MSATDLKRDISRLLDLDGGVKPLESVPAIGPRPGGVATGRPGGANEPGVGGGFIEADYLQREYWAADTLETSDGIFTWEEGPIKSVLLDTGDRAMFAEPVDPPAP